MTREAEVLAKVRLAASGAGAALFRNNVGVLLDHRGERVRFGLGNHSADLVGFTPVLILPDMVGQTVAVFTGLEVKAPGKRPTRGQAQWLASIKAAGGIAGWVDDPSQVEEVLKWP